jgi:hypothetical protein
MKFNYSKTNKIKELKLSLRTTLKGNTTPSIILWVGQGGAITVVSNQEMMDKKFALEWAKAVVAFLEKQQ